MNNANTYLLIVADALSCNQQYRYFLYAFYRKLLVIQCAMLALGNGEPFSFLLHAAKDSTSPFVEWRLIFLR